MKKKRLLTGLLGLVFSVLTLSPGLSCAELLHEHHDHTIQEVTHIHNENCTDNEVHTNLTHNHEACDTNDSTTFNYQVNSIISSLNQWDVSTFPYLESPLSCDHEFDYSTLVDVNDRFHAYQCIQCGSFEEHYINHDYRTVHLEYAINCATPGELVQECQGCGHVFFQVYDTIPHNLEQTEYYDGDCSTKGYTISVCLNCDFEQKIEDIIDPLKHVSDGNWIYSDQTHCESVCSICHQIIFTLHERDALLQSEPTCIIEGLINHECIHCGDIIPETIPLIDTHHFPEEEGTHKDDTHHWNTCLDCGALGIKREHYWEKVYDKAPSCAYYGVIEYNCFGCGASKIDYDYNQPECDPENVTVFFNENEHWETCSFCNKVPNKVPHVFVETNRWAGTCLFDGEVEYTCDCGYSYTESIGFTEHTIVGQWYLAGEFGEYHYAFCGGCDEYAVYELHDFELLYVIEEPTCYSYGESLYRCICGEYKNEITPMLEHDMDLEWSYDISGHWYSCLNDNCVEHFNITDHTFLSEVTIPSTCNDEGLRTYICECGYSYVEAIEVLDHEYSNGFTYDGTHHWYDCETSDCNHAATKEEHVFAVEVLKEATLDEEGLKEYTCECGYSYRSTISKLNPSSEPTYTENDWIIVVVTSVTVAGLTIALSFVFMKRKELS